MAKPKAKPVQVTVLEQSKEVGKKILMSGTALPPSLLICSIGKFTSCKCCNSLYNIYKFVNYPMNSVEVCIELIWAMPQFG